MGSGNDEGAEGQATGNGNSANELGSSGNANGSSGNGNGSSDNGNGSSGQDNAKIQRVGDAGGSSGESAAVCTEMSFLRWLLPA